MFNFRIITCPDGIDIIDRTLRTPYNALTPLQMLEYTEIDNQIAYMERIKKQEQREAERKNRMMRNPLYRLVSMFGLI